jgi:hypothetical protein
MTDQEYVDLKSFKNYCMCGGFAWQLNGRPQSQPHMGWCPQLAEYAEWYQAHLRISNATSKSPQSYSI